MKLVPDNFPLELNPSPSARTSIELALKESGIEIKDAYNVLKEGLSAVKVTYDKLGDGHEDVDYKERRDAAVLILTMVGHLKSKVDEVRDKTINIKIDKGDIERLENITREIDALNKRLGVEVYQRGEVVEAEVVG